MNMGTNWDFIDKKIGPVNTIKVMLSWSFYVTTLFPGQAYFFKQLTNTCLYSFARNWQLPFLNSGRERMP